MKYKIEPNFFSIVAILIIGSSLFREYNSETGNFPKKALAAIYVVALILSIAFMIKKTKQKK